MRAVRVFLSVLLMLALVGSAGAAWATQPDQDGQHAAHIGVAERVGTGVSPTDRDGRSGDIRPAGTVSAADVTTTIPTDPQASAFDFCNTVQPFSPVLIHETDPAVGSIEDHVYTVWLESGEDAIFQIDGPDTPSVDLDLYVYPPGTTDFADPEAIHFADTDSDEGIQIDGVITEGYWFVRINSKAGTGAQDRYDFYWYFESPDDEIPGIALPAGVTSTRIDEHSDIDDVFSLWLTEGETVSIRLVYPLRGHWMLEVSPELYLFGPGSTSIWTDEAVASSTPGDSFQHRLINFTAPVSGVYFLDVYQPLMPTSTNHADFVTLTVKRVSPVYRFYNKTNGTHFYTPLPSEVEMVMGKWPHIYEFEGAAYTYDSGRATTPLIRLYNKQNASHFYTASEAEALSAVAKWPHVFAWDGPTYAVSPGQIADSRPVYRFYNRANGSHFYTASPDERDMVLSRWGNVYSLEGPAFYLPQ